MVMALVDSVGTGLFLAGSALFFTRALKLTSNQVGIVLSLGGVAGLVFSVPLGRLADRFGSPRLLAVIYAARGLGFLAYSVAGNFVSVILIACLLGVGERSSGPIFQALVGSIEEADSRVRTMAAMNVTRNVGFTVGALLATLAIASNTVNAYRAVVLANAVSFFVAAALLERVVHADAPTRHAPAARAAVRIYDARYLVLAGLNGVLFLHTVVLSLALPLWIATRTHAPSVLIGVVVAFNTVFAITLGVPLSRGAEGVRAAASRQHRAGWCLATCCLLIASTDGLGAAQASAIFLAAAVVLTLGEIWQSVGAWGLSYGLSSERQRNFDLTVYNLGDTAATIFGPVLLTAGTVRGGPMGWMALAGVFAAAGVAVRLIARSAQPPAIELSLLDGSVSVPADTGILVIEEPR